MQFRKLAAMAGTALLAGMTIAAPVMAANVDNLSTVDQMVSEDVFPMFVVGADASTADVAGAVNMAVKMASFSKTTRTVDVQGTSQTTLSGGVKISTPGTEMVPGMAMNSVKSVLTDSDMNKPFHFNAKLSGLYNAFRSIKSGE